MAFVCKVCQKVYTSRSGCAKHESVCRRRALYSQFKELVRLLDLTEETLPTENDCQEMTALDALVRVLTLVSRRKPNMAAHVSNNTTVTSSSNVHVGDTNNFFINLTSFGQEKLDVSLEKLRPVLRKHTEHWVVDSICRTHFDPDKPENHNFYISNFKDDVARVFNGKEWVVLDGDQVTSRLVGKHVRAIDQVMTDPELPKDKEPLREKWEKQTYGDDFDSNCQLAVKKLGHRHKKMVKQRERLPAGGRRA